MAHRLVDVALGVQAVLVLGLLRAYWRLAERVARLEGRLNSRDHNRGD